MYRVEAGAKPVSWHVQRKIPSTTDSVREKTQGQDHNSTGLHVSLSDGDCKVLTMTETKTGSHVLNDGIGQRIGDRYTVHALKQMIDEVGDP